MTFDELSLDPRILEAVKGAGYTTPTPIQEQGIPAVLGGRDVTGIAQTGTGKTAAFVLPMIHKLGQGRAKARMPRSLILEPTRELAAQVAEQFEKYGSGYKLNMALLIGGVSFGDQEKKLNAGADVLIATPGRLMDHFGRGGLLMTGVQMLVIDEADRMLDMGFIPDIEKICTLLPKTRQTLLFSATMPPEITKLAKQFQKEPVRIEVSKPATTASTITQYVTHCPSNEDTVKRAVLRSIIKSKLTDQGIVFCNRKTEVDIVAKSLASHGFDAAAIHGDLPQSQRMATLDRFRNKDLKLLVASDVAARGLDIPEVSQVFNYAPPPNSDDYVHRIGRTGRAGRLGQSFTIVSPGDTRLWDAVLKRIGKDVEQFVPDGMDEAVSEARSRGPAPGRDRFDKGRGGGRGRGRDRGRGSERREERAPREDRPQAEPAAIVAAPSFIPPQVEDMEVDQIAPGIDAEEPAREEQPKREGRSRGGRNRDRNRGGDRNEQRGDRNESRGDRDRSDRDRGGRNRRGELVPGDPQGGDEKFKGMGDHVPAFLLRTLGKREEA
ncbi:MAG TPA: DEAD/DEAH box helicase [Hyphomonadaceae bacterium]|nr:DEAD/DEAH box helicase [Hyphomonadaceae bacterium]HPN05566.1 DEAD/DEAH box helicase [Hyphomonadaceae bacterium]